MAIVKCGIKFVSLSEVLLVIRMQPLRARVTQDCSFIGRLKTLPSLLFRIIYGTDKKHEKLFFIPFFNCYLSN